MNTQWGIWVLLVGMAVLLVAVLTLLGRVKSLADRLAPGRRAGNGDGGDAGAAPGFDGIPGEVVAAIAGALMAYAQPGKRLAVRSIRRAPEQSAWARAGRMEQVNNRI